MQNALGYINAGNVDAVLDIGCGFGGITRAVGQTLAASQLSGLDIDPDVLSEARDKGVDARCVDVEREPLPYSDAEFDLVFSLGMLDYLPTFDGLFIEVHRVLPSGGYALFSIPNLGSWHNRLALLLGFQPRDVEISDCSIVGALPHYRSDEPAGHLHTATLRAFRELAYLHGFDELVVTGGSWSTRTAPRVALVIDQLLARWPSLARRFFYLGTKSSRPVEHTRKGWWKGRDRPPGCSFSNV